MEDQAQEQSTVDRMAAYLEVEEPSEDPPAEEGEQEVAEQASDEDTPEETRKLKLKRGEEEIEIPEEEAIELAQKGYDYTKKTQALAEERKLVEERAQALQAQEQYLKQYAQAQNALIKEVAKIESLNDQIEQFEKLDWNQLTDNDPVQAQKLFIQYQQLTSKRQQLGNDISQKHYELQAHDGQRRNQALAEGYKQLSREIPDWNAEKANEARDAGRSYGFTDGELDSVIDPRMVRVLHDAALYRSLQKSRPQVEKKIADKPAVIKPAGKDAKAANRTQNADLRSQLRKTGKDEYAAKLIERML